MSLKYDIQTPFNHKNKNSLASNTIVLNRYIMAKGNCRI